VTRAADMVLVVTGVRPETTLAADAGVTLGVRGAIAVDLGSGPDGRPGPGPIHAAPLARISMQRIVPLRLAELEAEAPVLPPGDGGVGGQVGLAQDG